MKATIQVLLAVCAAAFLQGCDNGAEKAVSEKPGMVPGQKRVHVAFVAHNANDYWSLVRLGTDTAVRQLGDVDLDFRTPSDRTASEQKNILNQLIASGVDAIAISPIDADIQTEFLNSIPTNILLVCADSDAEKSRRACYIGTDNVAAGKQAAELLKAALPSGGKVALFVGYANAQNAKERIVGIKSGLAGSNLEIVDTLVDGTKADFAQINAQQELIKYPDLAGMVGLYSYDGPAILTAVRSAGKNGKVKIVCFDEDSDTLAGIASGDIYGAILQKPFSIGRQTIIWIDKALHGDKTQSTDAKVFIPTMVVTRENVESVQTSLKNIFQN